jgi:uncharacterized protein (UPF0332 family)
MNMPLDELLRKRLIEKVEPDKEVAADLLHAAQRDLKTATDNLGMGHYDWAVAIAYNAMLQAGRAIMAFKGYRAFSESHHLAVVQFCASFLPSETSPLVTAFNKLRVRRHDVVYGEISRDSVGKDEAERALGKAQSFITVIQERIRSK